MKIKKNKKLSSSQIIMLGFLGVIAVGTIFLMLPWSRRVQEERPFWMRCLRRLQLSA